jgi:hypothetical protein
VEAWRQFTSNRGPGNRWTRGHAGLRHEAVVQ